MLQVILLTGVVLLLGALVISRFRHRTLLHELNDVRQQCLLARRQIERQNYLASEIAHDIKNPLTAILCSAEALDLMLGKTLQPAHRRSLHFIHDYGDQVLRLLSDFLDMSRIQAGQIKSRKERVQVTKACESVLGLLAALAEREQVQLSVVVLSALPAVVADPVHLKQILFNLVHNAVKFSGAGSEVSIILSIHDGESALSIEVADNGVGIAADRLPTLFNPYEHFDHPSNGKRQHGLGLGLSLCRSLVELEGGSLTVNSELGKGTSFSFALPVDRTEVSDGDELPSVAEQQLAQESSMTILDGQRILVIDSDAGARAALSDLISAWGAVVDSVRQAEDAVQALTEFEYDTILIDTFAAEDHLTRLMPIVKGTSHNRGPRIVCAGERAGAVAHEGVISVDKPINTRELLGVLLADTLH